jgi:hypothetical protein
MKILSQHALNIGIVGLFALSTGACTAQTDVDENLETNVQDLVVSGFNGFGQISPKTFISAPAVVARGSDVIDVFATDSSNQIFANGWSSVSGWSGWSVLSGGGTALSWDVGIDLNGATTFRTLNGRRPRRTRAPPPLLRSAGTESGEAEPPP